MKILVADDHTLVRAGLTSLIARLPEMEVVGEAADGRQALRMVRDLLPDIVLMDIAMPGLNGLEAAERIHGIHPKTKIIILSMHASEEYVAQALKAGASGYLLKDAATAELEMALKSVSMGQFYLSPAISRQVVDNYLRGGPTGVDVLTPTPAGDPAAHRRGQIHPRHRRDPASLCQDRGDPPCPAHGAAGHP